MVTINNLCWRSIRYLKARSPKCRNGLLLLGVDFLSLQALVTLGNSKIHALAFAQNPVPISHNRAEVHKNIVSAIPRNKAKSLAGTKPFNASGFPGSSTDNDRFTFLFTLSLFFARGGFSGVSCYLESDLLQNKPSSW